MPRKSKPILIPIEGPLPYKKDRLYTGRIDTIKIPQKGNRLLVRIIHDDYEMAGRLVETTLPLPVRPDNPTYQFLKACGITELAEGKSIDASRLIAIRVGMRMADLDEAGKPKSIVFEPIKPSSTHEKD